MRGRDTGPGWWYEDKPKKKRQNDHGRDRGYERYHDGGEYVWRGSIREHAKSNPRPTPYTDDEPYGDWRQNRMIQGGWGNDRNSGYPLVNHRASHDTGHEWGRRVAYDTGADRDYDGRDYDRNYRRW